MGYFSGKDIEDEELRNETWRKVEDMMEKYGIEMDFFDYQREYIIDLILADPVRDFKGFKDYGNDGFDNGLDSGIEYADMGLRSTICVYDDDIYNDCFGFKPFSETIVSIENIDKENNLNKENAEVK